MGHIGCLRLHSLVRSQAWTTVINSGVNAGKPMESRHAQRGASLSVSTLAVVAFAVPLAAAWALALTAAWRRQGDELLDPEGWALADRGLGGVRLWLVLGATVFTAYTYLAVPGLAYLNGGIAFYGVAYAALVVPIGFVVLPRLRDLAAEHGFVTAADWVRARHGSHVLALAVALTSVLAAIPYLALQVVGVRTLLAALDLDPASLSGKLTIVVLFVIHSVATYRGGIRVPISVSGFKALLVIAVTVAVVAALFLKLGSFSHLLANSQHALTARGGSLLVSPGAGSTYATLAIGSALALMVYPHIITVTFASRSASSLRRAVGFLPVWTAILGCFTLLGVIAAGLVPIPSGGGALAVPLLIRRVLPDWAAGLTLGALVIAALVPVATLAVGASTLIVRNIYSEYINPTATPKHEVQVARFASVVLRGGAVAFAFAVHPQQAVDFHLLGGVWILQVFPAVVISLYTAWFHPRALVIGWAVGMAAGTWLSTAGGFSPTVTVPWGSGHTQIYTALVALLLNLAVVTVLTLLLDRLGVPRGVDATVAGQPPGRRGRSYAMRVN